MKILLVGPFPDPIHGMSLANQNLYEMFSQDDVFIEKHDVVFEKKLKSKEMQGRFNVLFFIKALCNSLSLISKIIFGNYDVIYITPGQSVLGFLRYFPAVIFSKMLSRKVVQHIHGSKLVDNFLNSNVFFEFLCKINILLSDKFIILSDTISKDFQVLIPKAKICICMNGVEIPHCASVVESRSDINILFLSNLMKDKGILDVIKSVELNNKAGFHYHFAGEVEADIKNDCISFFENNKDKCTFHGVVSGKEKRKLFNNADVFLLPSYDEGVPLSILESYSYSCAVITTRVGGIPDVFKDGVNGLFVPVGQPELINNALIKVSKQLAFYKANNRKQAIDKYSINIFYNKVKDIISKVI